MNKSLFLVVVVILICNQLVAGRGEPVEYPSAYDSVKFVEKVYLHTDRDIYYSGDDIWFRAYLVDAFNSRLSDHSHNLYVELISPGLKVISNRIIRLEGGLGNGDFKTPEDIRTGTYTLRAYTNYMRNFSEQLFFTKEISVINSNDDQTEMSEKVSYTENNITVNFFPESGSLVDNVSSIVAFKAVDNLGKGCDVNGKVFSSDGSLITTFKSTHLGMGKFFLRPLPGLKYYSIIRGADSIDVKTDLPLSFPTGVIFSVTLSQENELIITTKTNSETLALISDNDLVLGFSVRQEVIDEIPVRIRTPLTSFIIPTDYLPAGILMLTLSAGNDLPLSQRLVYLERDAPSKIKIVTDKSFYEKREPVSVRISLSEDSTEESECYASLAVVDETFTNITSHFPRSICSWFLLESDIHGIVEEPSYYFDRANTERLNDMELLLLTQGWRDFSWKYDRHYYPPEDGFGVSGKLRKNKKDQLLEDSRVSIGIFGSTNTQLTTVPVDSVGRFKLSGIDLTGEAVLIVSGIDKKDNPKGLLTLDSVMYKPPQVSALPQIVISGDESQQNKLRSYYKINEAVRKKYKLSDTLNIGGVDIISERHKDPQIAKIETSRIKYVKPDAELIVTEQMLGYNNMLHLLNSKIPGVEVLGDTSIAVRGIGSLSANLPPLILIDGKQATFADLVQMPIFLVDRIDVLKSVFSTNIYGFQAASGVINLITKAGGVPAIYNSPDYSAKHRISGYNAPRIFYSPQHFPDTDSDLKPDLRNTLLWNPDLKLNANNELILKFYNGDNSSLIRIIAEGITASGIPVTGMAEYEVK
jgi:hypothetical protein